jgi:chemotaxis protein histidine kinase CheA
LRRTFAEELPGKLLGIEQTAASLAEKGWDADLAESLYVQAHRLSGSSGVYGFTSVSRAGSALEQWLAALIPRPDRPLGALRAELWSLLQGLRDAFSSSEPAGEGSGRNRPG